MTQDAKVSFFVSKLNAPLDTRLQSLRLTTFANVLNARRPIEQEISRNPPRDNKPYSKENPNCDRANRKREIKNPT